MNYHSFAFAFVLLVIGVPACAQNPILDLRGTTYSEKMVFAVYDLRNPAASVDAIERAVVEAIRLYARDASVRRGIPPMPYPDYPKQMALSEQPSGAPRSICQGELFSVSGLDTSMAKYGEVTFHRACLFPYAGGYRVNYLAIYGQQSGLGAKNPNVLAAMFGRVMAKAVGLGDSSKFVSKIMDRMEEGFQSASLDFKLVQLHPQDMEGRKLVQDDLVRPEQPVQQASVSNQSETTRTEQVMPSAQIQPIQPVVSDTANPTLASTGAEPQPRGMPVVSNEQIQKMILIQQMREISNRQIAAMNPEKSEPQPPKEMTPADARKELTAMGLQYFSSEQFLAAVKRGDKLAVDLFITGSGVDINASDNGKTALIIAENAGHQEIAALLRSKGAR